MNKIEVKIMNNYVELDPTAVVKKEMFEYTDETTFKEMLNFLKLENILNDGSRSMTMRSNGEKYIYCIEFVIIKGKIEWSVPYEEIKLVDYINTYNLDEIILYLPKEIGGIDLPHIDWEMMITMLNDLKPILEFAVLLKDVIKIRKDIKEKFLNHKRGCVPLNTVEKAIKRKDYWSLDEFKFEMNLEEDEPLAILLLTLAGYIYDEKNKLYFYNKTLDEKHSIEFCNLVNEYTRKYGYNKRY